MGVRGTARAGDGVLCRAYFCGGQSRLAYTGASVVMWAIGLTLTVLLITPYPGSTGTRRLGAQGVASGVDPADDDAREAAPLQGAHSASPQAAKRVHHLSEPEAARRIPGLMHHRGRFAHRESICGGRPPEGACSTDGSGEAVDAVRNGSCIPDWAFMPEPRVRTLQSPECDCGLPHGCGLLDRPRRSLLVLGAPSLDALARLLRTRAAELGADRSQEEEVLVLDPEARLASNTELALQLQGALGGPPEAPADALQRLTLVTTNEASEECSAQALVRAANAETVLTASWYRAAGEVAEAAEDGEGGVPPVSSASRCMLLTDQWRQQELLGREGRAELGGEGSGSGLAVSFALQYFRRPSMVAPIAKRLQLMSVEGGSELLVNIDSGADHAAWMAALSQEHGRLMRYTLVTSPNVHEIRAYNRLAKMAEGRYVVFLQDDDLPPMEDTWLQHAISLFQHFADLSLLGGYTGKIQGGPLCGKFGLDAKGVYGGRGRNKIPLALREDPLQRPFMFATQLNLGPFMVRRDRFLEIGMFNTNFSCRGEPGIGFDYEYSARTWFHNYTAGVMRMHFEYRAAGKAGGTRASRDIYRQRQRVETRNTRLKVEMYKGWLVAQGAASEGDGSACRRKPVLLRGVNRRVYSANARLAVRDSSSINIVKQPVLEGFALLHNHTRQRYLR